MNRIGCEVTTQEVEKLEPKKRQKTSMLKIRPPRP